LAVAAIGTWLAPTDASARGGFGGGGFHGGGFHGGFAAADGAAADFGVVAGEVVAGAAADGAGVPRSELAWASALPVLQRVPGDGGRAGVMVIRWRGTDARAGGESGLAGIGASSQ